MQSIGVKPTSVELTSVEPTSAEPFFSRVANRE
jgi:hypothetical protein